MNFFKNYNKNYCPAFSGPTTEHRHKGNALTLASTSPDWPVGESVVMHRGEVGAYKHASTHTGTHMTAEDGHNLKSLIWLSGQNVVTWSESRTIPRL